MLPGHPGIRRRAGQVDLRGRVGPSGACPIRTTSAHSSIRRSGSARELEAPGLAAERVELPPVGGHHGDPPGRAAGSPDRRGAGPVLVPAVLAEGAAGAVPHRIRRSGRTPRRPGRASPQTGQ